MITLYNVIDIRNGNFYTVVVCKQRQAKYFIPAPVESEV